MKYILLCLSAILLASCGSTPEKPPANTKYEYTQDFNDISSSRIAFTGMVDKRDAIILELNSNAAKEGEGGETKTWLATKDVARIVEESIRKNLEQYGLLDNTSNLVLSGELLDVQNQSLEGSPGSFYLSITTRFTIENAGEVAWSQEIKAGSIVKEADMKRSIDDAFAKSLNQLIGELLMDENFLKTLDQ